MGDQTTPLARTESLLTEALEWLRLVIETFGVIVITVGVVIAAAQAVSTLGRPRDQGAFVRTRLTLARYLALALEFQLAGDLIATAIAPTWTRIGQLAAIAVIRTALNFFLS